MSYTPIGSRGAGIEMKAKSASEIEVSHASLRDVLLRCSVFGVRVCVCVCGPATDFQGPPTLCFV